MKTEMTEASAAQNEASERRAWTKLGRFRVTLICLVPVVPSGAICFLFPVFAMQLVYFFSLLLAFYGLLWLIWVFATPRRTIGWRERLARGLAVLAVLVGLGGLQFWLPLGYTEEYSFWLVAYLFAPFTVPTALVCLVSLAALIFRRAPRRHPLPAG